ncbi:hypothetical protein FNO01nite_09090 [Flavobacterium noncentrifugens]|nr:hypothetical protein FNO01nite_09090 [Flavobacterium noncentrifugens]
MFEMKKITQTHLNSNSSNETKTTSAIERKCSAIFNSFQHAVKWIAVALLLIGSYTDASAQCPTPPGDPSVYGVDSWIGYVYSAIDAANPPTHPFTSPTLYKGYVTQPEIFDQNLGAGAISGANVCGTYTDGFSVRFRMTRTFPAGSYTFTIGGDDGVRLSFDGGATWEISDWNYHSYQTTSKTIYLSGTKNLVLENYDQGGDSRVTFTYTALCDNISTAPTTVSAPTSICNGSSTTLTVSGGTALSGSYYVWGTGTTVGLNPIAGQTGASISVSPSTTTSYWVRRKDAAPCNAETNGLTTSVTVNAKSTAPTAITGTTTICAGNNTTLTAANGTLAPGATYEWGTGAVTTANAISGQTGASINVSPTATTTYWVRRLDTGGSCAGYTAEASAVVTVNIPAGDQTSYGNGSWIGYVYASTEAASPPSNAFTTTYRGYITETETFNHNWVDAGPSGGNICGSYVDLFAVKFKMKKNFPAGWYTFTVGGDDGYRLSIDGGATYLVNNFVDHSYTSSVSNAVYLSGDANLVLDFYERTGQAQVSFAYTACNNYSTAPTTITGTTLICSGTNTTLAASGGNAAPGTTYQWGTGSTTLSTGTSASYTTANLTGTTTYWVRRVDPTPCNVTTDMIYQTVTVNTKSTTPATLTASPNNCNNVAGGISLTAGGNIMGTGAVYQWGTTNTVNNTTAFLSETTGTISVNPTATTIYWVRRVDAAPCSTTTGSLNITVYPASIAPTSITTTATTVCAGTNPVITINGGALFNGGYYQWGYGAISDANQLGTTTGTTFTVYPTATTTYWVRAKDNGSPCTTVTATASLTITVNVKSTNPSSISASSTCNNVTGGVSLTATGGTVGTGSVYQWGTTNTVSDANAFLTESTGTITVNSATPTVYWVRRIDATPCSTTPTGSVNITIYPPSIAPTSLTTPVTTICAGTNPVITIVGGTLFNGAYYQWGYGAVSDANQLGTTTGTTFTVYPSATTTYWVRIKDNGSPCSNISSAVSLAITVNVKSTNPTSISATSTCNNVAGGVQITAVGGTMGTGAVYQWGTTNTVNDANAFRTESTGIITVNPTAPTVYWVRRVDASPCSTTPTGSVNITIYPPSIAPTSLTGTAAVCSATNPVLTIAGGTLFNGAYYQWGSGIISDANQLGTTTATTFTVYPTVTTTYWVRIKDNGSPCATISAAVSLTVTVTPQAVAPNGVSGTTTICRGASTTLTATGATGTSYQWGTGTVSDANAVGTGNPITLTPLTTTTYWVRMVQQSPCTGNTGTYNVQVNVTQPSVAPTSITVSGTAGCPGTSRTLTATGSTLAGGASYQWGTGTVSDANAIAGTGNAITVTPFATTTYWVRIKDTGICSAYTTSASVSVVVNAPAGDPTAFGNNAWNVYGYLNSDITLATNAYLGYYIQTAITGAPLTFDSSTSWGTATSPSSATGYSGCAVPVDNFVFTAKRKGFPCGTYTLKMLNWDDVAELYVDGVRKWNCDSYSGGGACVGDVTGTFNLNENSTIEIRIKEIGGNANAALALTNITIASTAPATIAATNDTVCSGGATTITASGGTAGTNAVFEWGTGTVGDNIITGQTAALITVNPTITTTYWVRRKNSFCGTTTTAITKQITITGSVAGTISTAPTTICKGTKPKDIVLTGQTGSVIKWQTATNAAFTTGVTDIASTATTLTSAAMQAITATTYYRAVIQNGGCSAQFTNVLQIIIPADITYQNGVWSGTPDQYSTVTINSNLTLTSDLHVCSCQVTNGAVVTVGVGQNLVIINNLTVDTHLNSNIVVEDQGSIVQFEDAAVDIGSITVKRKTSTMKDFDFSYWSSPVQNQTLFDLSPLTRYDKYYSFNPITNAYVIHENGAAIMQPATGYLLRAPAGWSTANATNGIYEGTFKGIPNNGVVPVTIKKGAGTFNLIGNPYPSAIDIDAFLTDPVNASLVNGTIYLWTHNTAIASANAAGLYTYTSDDYAKYNLTGGVKTGATALTGGVKPDGKVASGQGFFIEAKTGLANGSYTANFKNNMRVVGHNGSFYKNQGPVAHTVNAIEKSRLWLDVSNSEGAFNELLVGYVTGATNEFDDMYDGKTMAAGNKITAYTISGSDTYAIQGRQLPFSDDEIIPVGYVSTIATNFTIRLDEFDGLFQSQDVYLIDNQEHVTHNLKNSDYTFATAAGTFNTRFEIRFKTATLATENHTANTNAVVISTDAKQVKVNASKAIETVEVYDLLGRRLFGKNKINTLEFKTAELTQATQVLVVKVRLENGYETSQKVIIK